METYFVPDHFDYIKKLAGPSIIGFGGDYDGVTRQVETLTLPTFTFSNIAQKCKCLCARACACACVQGTNRSGGCV